MDREDLVQDVLLSAYKHFSRIREKEAFLNYLIRSAKYRTIGKWAKSQRQMELLKKYQNNFGVFCDRIEEVVDIELMYRAMCKLPRKQREDPFLFEFCDFSMKERKLLKSIGYPQVRLNRM